MGKRRRKRISCPNCGTHLKEEMNYCFNCGQENHVKRVSMKMLTGDFVSTYFSADSKVFTSLRYLITKPSFLSLEYLNGKIEAYLRPIRLYVFISFTFFLFLGMISTNDSMEGIIFTKDGKEITIDQVEDLENGPKEAKPIQKYKQEDTVLGAVDDDFENKLERIFSSKKEATYFYGYFRSKLPILLFIIIPIFAGFLFISFYKKEFYYIDHLVFALHLQSFLFILLFITYLFEWITNIDIHWMAVLGLLVYGFIAARRFYKRKWISTFLRLSLAGILHSFFSMIILSLFFLLIVKTYSI